MCAVLAGVQGSPQGGVQQWMAAAAQSSTTAAVMEVAVVATRPPQQRLVASALAPKLASPPQKYAHSTPAS